MTAAPYCSIFLFFVWLLCRSLCSDGLVLRPSVHRLRNGMNRPLSSDVFDRSFDRRASIISIYQTPKWKDELHWDPVDPATMTNTIASGLVALLIVLTTFLFPVPTAAIETTIDTVELSKGAIVVQTTSNTLLKSTIDSKSLLKTLFVNRQELSASLERMQSTISQELASPVWKEIQKEFLAVEGDLASSIQVTGPNNVKDTVRDVVAGKLNLIVNGELVNIAIQPNLGENQDEVVISIKGFKGTNISPLSFTLDDDGPRYGPIRSYFSKYEAFWSWWATPYPAQYLLPNMRANNGDILLVGTAGTIWIVYLASYVYYEYEKEQEIKVAEAKRQKTVSKAKIKKISAKPVDIVKDEESEQAIVMEKMELSNNDVVKVAKMTESTKEEVEKVPIVGDDDMIEATSTEESVIATRIELEASEKVEITTQKSSTQSIPEAPNKKSNRQLLQRFLFWRKKE